MNELVQLASIIVLGVAAQYLASLLRLPSILLLLLTGIVFGPVMGALKPDELFGIDLLTSIVSLCVALILFEGGLTLRFKELPGVAGVVRNLISVGAAITWVLAALAARWILGFEWGLSILLGAILVVTGPTVIDPLVRHIKPTAPVGPILRWEGIVIDPIGALLAVLVFEFLVPAHSPNVLMTATKSVALTIFAGGGLGAVGALLLMYGLKHRMISEHLINPMSVMLVLAVFTASNEIQHESGLFAVTVMGIMLANQSSADVRHILEFKENLRVLLISSLFILLSARVQRADLLSAGLAGVAFTVVLIIVVRPIAAWISTLGSPLSFKQRLFIGWMAPRGIVAAAVSAVFAIRLSETQEAAGESSESVAQLVPVTFFVIVGTVLVYGLTAPLIARRLGIAEKKPQGVLIVGAHAWGRELARVLKASGFDVLLVDTNRANTGAARLAGLPSYHGGILTEHALAEIDLTGIGRLLALTPNHEVNALACQRFAELFGKDEVFQLSRGDSKMGSSSALAEELRGRRLFGESVTYGLLTSQLAAGAEFRTTPLTAEFDYAKYRAHYGDSCIPLLVITEDHHLTVITDGGIKDPVPGDTVVSLITPGADSNGASLQ